ncbi:MAG: hypothetical protein U0V75_02740 [Ferruginibacter sp.]
MGLDQQFFSFSSLSSPVPGWTIFSRQLCATSNFSYKFNFGSGQTVGKFPNFAKPWPLTASQPRAQNWANIFQFYCGVFFLLEGLSSAFVHGPAFGVLNLHALFGILASR